MKIVSLKTRQVYDIQATRKNENQMPCPECNQDRKHKGKKSFSWNNSKEAGYCFNCEASFVVDRPRTEKVYYVPEIVNNTKLTDRAVSYFEGRMISKETINKLKIYSSTEFMPQLGREVEVICFPYYRKNKVVNVKFRGPEKSFKLVKDAELTFFNLPSISDITDYCIITEGEIDTASFVHAGFNQCVSVPNGAKGSNLDYLDPVVDIFERIEKIYIAVDTDEKGILLRDELCRRLGPEKCFIVEYNGFKDANELLVKSGGLSLSTAIKNARPAKVEGLVDISEHYSDLVDLYRNGMKSGKTLNIPELDSIISWELGRLAVVTGVPGHGKSEFVDFVVSKLNIIHGWKVAYFSPENFPMKYHLMKLIPKISGKKFVTDELSENELKDTFDYINENYQFIAPDDDQTFERIIELAMITVKRNGVKILVIDPYNKIEHKRDKSETETEYISRFLDKLIVFAKIYGVLIFLVAHPRKMPMQKDTMKVIAPTLYDINGSANFYNKCDYGISVYRDREKMLTNIQILKVKFRHLGEGGECDFTYNYFNGRYMNKQLPVSAWQRDNWYYEKVNKEQSEVITMVDAIRPNTNFDYTETEEDCPF